MIKKLQEKIKKMSSTSSMLLKAQHKNNISNVRIALGIQISTTTTHLLVSPKRTLSKTRNKFATSTPNSKNAKQQIK
jgi:hypothetical protein